MEERRPVPDHDTSILRRATAAILALAAVGLARMAWFHLAVEPRSPNPPPIDERYRPIRGALPLTGTIGYVSDRRVARTPSEYEVSPGTRKYIEAQYALAPLILRVDDDRAPAVLVEAVDAAAAAALLDRRKLLPVADSGRGVVVARPGDR